MNDSVSFTFIIAVFCLYLQAKGKHQGQCVSPWIPLKEPRRQMQVMMVIRSIVYFDDLMFTETSIL